jgi:hypothetical protein
LRELYNGLKKMDYNQKPRKPPVGARLRGCVKTNKSFTLCCQQKESTMHPFAAESPVGARLQRAAAGSIFENGVGGHALKTRASLRV